MSLRTVVLRQTRLLQTCNRPAIMPLSALNVVARRSFRVYAPRRTNGEDSKTTSADPSTGNTKSAEPAEEAASTSQPPSDSASKDVPPSPQKRDIDPKDREIAELKDKYLRSVAEFRNLQLQTRREVTSAQAYTIQRFSSDLLDTIDLLTTSLESDPPLPPLETTDPNQKEDILVTEHRNLHEGLRMVEHILLKTLERHGLNVIPTEGEVNPVFHEAVKEVEGEKVGTIADVIKRGYTLNGKVLRPAKVAIVKAKSQPTES